MPSSGLCGAQTFVQAKWPHTESKNFSIKKVTFKHQIESLHKIETAVQDPD